MPRYWVITLWRENDALCGIVELGPEGAKRADFWMRRARFRSEAKARRVAIGLALTGELARYDLRVQPDR